MSLNKVLDQALWNSVTIVDEQDDTLKAASRRPLRVRDPKTPEELELEKEARTRKLKTDEAKWMEDHMAQLKEDAGKATSEHERVFRLQQEFPDLRSQIDRWKNRRYKSERVNSQCEKYEWVRSCGCCPDPAIWAQPYVDTALGRVYSNPFQFYVGEGRTHTWMREEHGWEEKMRAASIPESLITTIRDRLDGEVRIADESED